MPQTITTTYLPAPSDTWNVKENTSDYQSTKSPRIKNPHDKFFKAMMGDVTFAKDFLQHYLPKHLLEVTNLNTLKPQKDSYINKELEESFSDLLFKATIQDQTGYFYFLFEHKSYASKNTALQLLSYMLDIWKEKARKEHHWELPIIIPLVIYHGPRNWNSPRSLGKMIVGYDLLPNDLQMYVPDFEYIFYDLTVYSDEEIKGSAQLKAYLTICRDILTDDAEQFVHSLFKAVDYLVEIDNEEMRLSYFKLLMHYIFQTGKDLTEKETKAVTDKIPEGSEVVMTLAEKYRNEGKEEGLEKGREEGREKGREDATIEVAKRLILKGLDTKDIVEVTELNEKAIERLQKEMEQ